MPGEIPTVIWSPPPQIVKNVKGGFQQLTAEQALNRLVVTVGWKWLYVSEITGKQGLTGYDVLRTIFSIWLYLAYYLSMCGPCVLRMKSE